MFGGFLSGGASIVIYYCYYNMQVISEPQWHILHYDSSEIQVGLHLANCKLKNGHLIAYIDCMLCNPCKDMSI